MAHEQSEGQARYNLIDSSWWKGVNSSLRNGHYVKDCVFVEPFRCEVCEENERLP